MIVKPTYPLPDMPPGVSYKVVDEDACHFMITPVHFEGPVFRLPHRNVYVLGFDGEPDEIKRKIQQELS